MTTIEPIKKKRGGQKKLQVPSVSQKIRASDNKLINLLAKQLYITKSQAITFLIEYYYSQNKSS